MFTLLAIVTPQAKHGSSLQDAGSWAAIAAASMAFLLIVAGVIQWRRKQRRFGCISKWTNAGVDLRLRILDDKPDEPTMELWVNEWTDALQDDLRATFPRCLPDVGAAIVEALPNVSYRGFSERGSRILSRVDHVTRALRRYVPND